MTVLKKYREGTTSFLSADVEHYSSKKGQPTADMPVFYNPRMRTNRDMSVLALAAYARENKINLICEPLAGSGIRTLRYLNEIKGDFRSVMFDTNPEAVEIAKRNVRDNAFENRAEVIGGDARVLLITESRGKRFDCIDIDPFGSPTPFLNASIQAINPRGGLLGITATDMPALCGVYPRVALRKYGGISIRAPFVHELALRLVIGRTFFVAGLNDFSITPMVSLSTDHYVRVWLKTEHGRRKGNRDAQEIGFVRYCRECMNWETMPILSVKRISKFQHIRSDCSNRVDVAGPLWIGSIQSPEFVNRTNQEIERHQDSISKKTKSILQLITNEAPIENFYLDIHDMCDIYSWPPPKRDNVIRKLQQEGFKSVRSHFKPTAIRTNATVKQVMLTIKSLVREMR